MTEPLPQDEPFEPVVADRAVLHRGRVWDVTRETFDYNGDALVREVIEHPGAVAVLPLDAEDRVLLIQQYRHPVRQRLWEIPAGLLDVPGEPPLAAAQRELAEEADLVATEWQVLADFFNSPGGSNEGIRVFLARGLSATAEPFPRTEEEADMARRWVPLDAVVEAVLQGRLQSPTAAIGALAAAAARARGWAGLRDADSPWSGLRGRAAE